MFPSILTCKSHSGFLFVDASALMASISLLGMMRTFLNNSDKSTRIILRVLVLLGSYEFIYKRYNARICRSLSLSLSLIVYICNLIKSESGKPNIKGNLMHNTCVSICIIIYSSYLYLGRSE